MQTYNKEQMQKAFNDKRYECSPTRPKRKIDVDGNPVELRLSYEEFRDIWLSSGHWEERGKGRGKYVLSRTDDRGHYELGNVFVQLHTANARDGVRNNMAARGNYMKGRKSSQGPRASRKGIKMPRLCCIGCRRETTPGPFSRCHSKC